MGRPLARRLACAALVFSCCSIVPALALADESSAEAFFQEGLSAMKRSDFAVACEAFTQSNRQDPSPGTQINLALCFEKQKKWASAWTWYRSAVGLAQQRGQREREQLAEDSANRIKPQIHYVIVSIKEPLPDQVVKRDGNEVAVALGGKEIPLPIDAGEHTIEVTARGKKPFSKKITIADIAQTERLEIPKLDDAPVEDRGAGAKGGEGGTSSIVITNDGSTQRTVGIITGATGILAGLAGVGMFILAKGQAKSRDENIDKANHARPENKQAFTEAANTYDKAAKNDQLTAIILGAGGVVLVGVGVVLYLTAPKAASKVASSPVVPLLGSGFAGIGLSHAF